MIKMRSQRSVIMLVVFNKKTKDYKEKTSLSIFVLCLKLDETICSHLFQAGPLSFC